MTSLHDQDFELLVSLLHTTNAIVRARERELHQYGMTYMQAAVLFTIKAIGEEATPAEISRWLFREPHSVSGLLTRMEKTGLITKTKDLKRKNMVRVALTKKGEESFERSIRRESIHQIMSSLSKEERELLRSTLRVLRKKALKELGIDRKPRFTRMETGF